MMLKAILASFALILSCNAMATCKQGSETVFSCTTEKGKLIEVCDAKKTINYSFGKPTAKPEIVVRAPRNSVTTTQWAGMGRWMSYSVNIPNENTVYNVFWAVDRLADEHPIEAGVNVQINKQLVATVQCAGEQHIIQNIDGIKLNAAK